MIRVNGKWGEFALVLSGGVEAAISQSGSFTPEPFASFVERYGAKDAKNLAVVIAAQQSLGGSPPSRALFVQASGGWSHIIVDAQH